MAQSRMPDEDAALIRVMRGFQRRALCPDLRAMPRRIRLYEGNRKWWTLAAMCFALFMTMVDNTVLTVALPSIQRDLHPSISGLEWAINAYTLTFTVLLVTGGRLGDIFGRRTVFLGGVVTFALSSAFIGLAPNEALLVAGRAIQGVGAALMMPGTLSIISDEFPPEERGRAIGAWAGISGIALAIGPVVGGVLTDYFSWRAVFFVNVPVALGAIWITHYAVRDSRDETVERSVDVPGVAALSLGLTSLVLALIEADRWGWGSARIVALFAAAAAGLAAFAWIESRRRVAMLDFSCFRSRTFVGANVVAVVVSFALIGQFFFVALYMQSVLGFHALGTGVRFLPAVVLIVVTAPLAGWLADRTSPRRLLLVALGLLASSLMLQTRIDADSGYATLLPAFIGLGVAIGLALTPMSAVAMNAVEVAKAGAASGILSMSRMVGGLLGIAVTGTLFQALFRSRLNHLADGTALARQGADRTLEAVAAGRVSNLASGADQARLGRAARESFVYALDGSIRLSVAVAVVGAALVAVLIPGRAHAARPRVDEHRPDGLSEPLGTR
jgi:EmrB/QacA subfamily drug resistance transporter